MEETWQGKKENQHTTEVGMGNGASERWTAAISNLSEMGSTLDSLQKLLLQKAVYVDEEAFAQASSNSVQARNAVALERRVKTLERELDAAITASACARTEKRHAEAGQRAAEARTQEVLKELENTTKIFELYMEELRTKHEEIAKKDGEIKVLQAIIQTLSKGTAGNSAEKNL